MMLLELSVSVVDTLELPPTPGPIMLARHHQDDMKHV